MQPASLKGGTYLEIKVRDVPPDVARKLSQLAMKSGYRSREEYLRQQLRLMALYPEVTEKEDAYGKLITELTQVIQENTAVMQMVLERMGINE